MTDEGERIAAYRDAYRAANEKDIEITFDKGWFFVGRSSKWRGKKLDKCTEVLRQRAAQAIEAQRAATTKIDAVVDESAVATGDAPKE